MELPVELRAKVAAYLPKPLLKYLFNAAAIGTVCFARYYANIRLVGETSYLENPARGAEVCINNEFENPATRSIGGDNDFSHVEFSYEDDFVAFCESNIVNLDQIRLKSIQLDWHTYKKLDRRLLDRFDSVDLNTAYSFEVNGQLSQQFEKFQSNIHHQLGLLKVHCFSQTLKLTRLQTKFATLRSLVLKRVVLEDVAACFSGLPNLQNLELDETKLYDTQLVHLASSLHFIKLVNALHLSNRNIPLMFPENLKFLQIDHTLHYPETLVNTYLDLSQIANLECLYLISCVITSAADLWLPKSIKHLLFKSCYNLIDLNGIDTLVGLNSLHVLDPSVPDWINYLAQLPMPASMQHTRFDYYQELDLLADSQDVINFVNSQLKQLQTFSHATPAYRYKLSPAFRESTLAIVGENNLNRVVGNIVGPVQAVTILKVPQIKSLKLLQLPESLEKLHISLDLDGSEMVLPGNLKELSLTGCGLRRFKIKEFQSFKNLKRLNINGNFLGDDSVHFKDFPSSLEFVNLSGNLFSKIDLLHCEKLKVVDLMGCKFSTVSSETLRLPDSVESLQLCGNGISSIDCSFRFPTQVKTLSITNHELPTLSSEVFWSKVPDSVEHLELTPKRSTSFLGVEPMSMKNLESVLLGRACDIGTLTTLLSQCSALNYLHIIIENGTFDLGKVPEAVEKLEIGYIGNCTIKGNLNHLRNIREFDISMEDYSDEDIKSSKEYHPGEYSSVHIEDKLNVPPTLEFLHIFEAGVEDLESIFDFSTSSALRKLVFLMKIEVEPHDSTNEKIYSQEKIGKLFDFVERVKNKNANFSNISVNTWVPSQMLVQRCRDLGVELHTVIT